MIVFNGDPPLGRLSLVCPGPGTNAEELDPVASEAADEGAEVLAAGEVLVSVVLLGVVSGVLGVVSGVLGVVSGVLGVVSGVLGVVSGVLGVVSGLLGGVVTGVVSGVLGVVLGEPHR